MLLNTEELLALANGDAEPDRLADLLDRLEHCPESEAALQVLVSLKANREEALEALRVAADNDLTTSFPHPVAQQQATAGWGMQALRMAASVAIVAAVGFWAANSFVETIDATALAVSGSDYVHEEIARPPLGGAIELTSDASDIDVRLGEAYRAMGEKDFTRVIDILQGTEVDADGLVPLYLGIAYYFEGNYDGAVAQLTSVRQTPGVSTNYAHQAGWFQANALLALDQQVTALGVLEDVISQGDYGFKNPAIETHDALRAALGMTVPSRD